MARVLLTSEAREDVRDLDGAARKVVLKALKKLEQDPDQRGTPLGSPGGNLTTFRKLIVGDRDYRVVYRIERDGSVVVVWVVAKRADRECYDMAISRLQVYSDPNLAKGLKELIDNVWASTSSI